MKIEGPWYICVSYPCIHKYSETIPSTTWHTHTCAPLPSHPTRPQLRNRGGGSVVECLLTLLTGKFLLTYREKRGKEKRKNGGNGEENKENWKKEGGKLKMEGGLTKWGEDFFFNAIEICFGSTKMEIFCGEKHFMQGKKIRKNNFAPSEKFSTYVSARSVVRIDVEEVRDSRKVHLWDPKSGLFEPNPFTHTKPHLWPIKVDLSTDFGLLGAYSPHQYTHLYIHTHAPLRNFCTTKHRAYQE